MCPPDYFDVSYEINAWMHLGIVPDKTLAWEQWDRLHHTLTSSLSLDVSIINPRPGLPDMVFTANAGMVEGNTFLASRMRFPQRAAETPHFVRWFLSHGYHVLHLPEDGVDHNAADETGTAALGSHEGEGDALRYGNLILGGYGHRSSYEAQVMAGQMLGHPVLLLRLVDSRWYHLDTCLTPLSDRLIAYYPGAFDAPSVHAIEQLPGDKIVISEEDALRFAANAVVSGSDVVLNAGCTQFERDLQRHGYRPHGVPLDEFLKAGGAAKCLVLILEP
jgi:N-dimethylarginine dimethylaminohydrolase